MVEIPGTGRAGRRAALRLLLVLGMLCVPSCAGPRGADPGGARSSASGTTEPGAAQPSPAGSGPAGRWTPAPGTGWQWQLAGTVDETVDAPVYDVDVDTPDATVARLRARGRRVICYVNAGAYEDFRADRASFPAELLGQGNGWPGERWLDIRRLDLLGPILGRRLDECRRKGFDGVEPDNVDGYANATGFPLTADDQLAFNRFLAFQAHARGLAVGLKNDLDQGPALVGGFDFAIVEQCFENAECEATQPFARAGKAVFVAEYTGDLDTVCPQARRLGLSVVRKRTSLDAWREPCP